MNITKLEELPNLIAVSSKSPYSLGDLSEHSIFAVFEHQKIILKNIEISKLLTYLTKYYSLA